MTNRVWCFHLHNISQISLLDANNDFNKYWVNRKECSFPLFTYSDRKRVAKKLSPYLSFLFVVGMYCYLYIYILIFHWMSMLEGTVVVNPLQLSNQRLKDMRRPVWDSQSQLRQFSYYNPYPAVNSSTYLWSPLPKNTFTNTHNSKINECKVKINLKQIDSLLFNWGGFRAIKALLTKTR